MEIIGELATYSSHEQYNADTRVRSTSLKHIMEPQGPRAYYLKVVNPPVNFDKEIDANELIQPKVDDLVLGTLLHEFGLEGKKNWFVTSHRRGSNAWKDEVEENSPLWALTKTDDAKLHGWRDAMMRNKEVRDLVENGSFKEQSFKFSVDGVLCKARVDMFGFDGSIWDLKTTRATNRDEFERQLISLMYDFSASFYEMARDSVPEFNGMRAPFRHIVLSKTFPYYCYVWTLDRSYLRVGKQNVEEAFRRLKECRERESKGMSPEESWPDLIELNQSTPIAAPAWYLEKSGWTDRSW